jgi:hypothetical protein
VLALPRSVLPPKIEDADPAAVSTPKNASFVSRASFHRSPCLLALAS